MSCSRVVKTSPLIADILDYPSRKKNRTYIGNESFGCPIQAFCCLPRLSRPAVELAIGLEWATMPPG
jgi:hypothetical protein